MKRIPAAFLWVLAAFAGVGCSARPEPADLILRGGAPAGSDQSQSRGTWALAVSGKRIGAIGSEAEILARRGPATIVLQIDGATVIPGFVDHHVHLLNLGETLLNQENGQELFLDLAGVGSLEELAEQVRLRAEGQPPGTWILGKGWSQAAWGATQLPDNRVLTAAAPRHPVYLSRVDGHAGWANRLALELAGIDADTPDPPAGRIVRLPGGEPSGVLLERANEAVLAVSPQPSDPQIRRAFRLAAEKLAQQGVVEAFDAGFLAHPGVVGLNRNLERILKLLVEEDASEPLPVRVRLMIPAPSVLADRVLAEPGHFRELSPRIAITHLKLFADGAMGSRGASLSEPFADDPSTSGVARMSGDEIRSLTERALDAGLDAAVHAIGDLAVRRTLDAFESVLKARPGLNPRRLRVEHFSLAADEDFQRAARLGVGLSIQPNFVAPDDSGATMEDSRLGPERVGEAYAWGRLAELGAALAGGSDYFDRPGPPLLTFYCAATRANLAGQPPGGWHPDQKLSRERALRLATVALPAGGGERGGRLNPGGPADLTILSSDPLTTPDSEILGIRVLAVIAEGRVIFSKGRQGPPPPD